jgi:peptide/nickel transport system permease protein
VLLGVVALAVVLAPWLAPHDPDEAFTARALDDLGLPVGPSPGFPLGADSLGRCELSRLLYGGRVSFVVALVATAIAVTLGLAVGITAARARVSRHPWVDTLLMRFVDLVIAFPGLLLVMAITKAAARPGVWIVIVVLGLWSWTGMSRLVRARTLALQTLDYVEAARALGAGATRIVWQHLLPALWPLVVVVAASGFADMILAESALSFLGVGVVPPTSSWGSMLREGVALARTAPRLLVLPSVAIVTVTVAVNLIGEGMRAAGDRR